MCRVLFFTDIAACVTSFSAIAAAILRLNDQLPAPHAQPSETRPSFWISLPKAPIQNLFMAAMLVALSLQLVLMLRKQQVYQTYRTQLAVFNRLIRATATVTQNLSDRGRAPLVLSMAARLQKLQQQPNMALRVLALQPLMFFAQAALFVLPVKYVVLLQLMTTLSTLQWSRLTPCIFPHAALSGSSTKALYAAAERTCQRMQEAVGALHATTLSSDALAPFPPACSGVSAIQTLQIFCVLFVLFVLPVGGVFLLEAWLRAQHAPTQVSTDAPQQESSSHAGSSSSSSAGLRSSAGSTSAGAGSSAAFSAHHAQGIAHLATVSSRGQHSSAPVFGLPLQGLHLLLLAPAVPLLTWHLSELLSGLFAGALECPALV